MGRGPADVVEREVARDAHESAILLALLILTWGGVSLFFVPLYPFWLPNTLQVVVGTLAFAFFLATYRRPQIRAAVLFCAVVLLYSALLLPWTAVVWCEIGRPWEAFTVPQVAMVCMALVVPRYFWLGILGLTVFAADCFFVYFEARHQGLSRLIPIIEPHVSVVYGMLGLGLLVLREQRRQLARRHIQLHAEVEALHRVSPLFTKVRDELARRLAALSKEVGRLAVSSRPKASTTLRATISRLEGLNGQLGALVESEPAPGGDAPGPASEAERQLLARDAYSGAVFFCALLVGVAPLRFLLHQRIGGQLLALPPTILSAVLLIGLVRTWRRPSERRARWSVLLVCAALVPITTQNQFVLVTLTQPYELYTTHKFLMVGLAFAMASRLRLGILLIVLTALHALGFFFYLHMGDHRELFPYAEPWVVVVFMLIAIASLVMRDQRRVASVRVLRAESEAFALQRRALLLLALRDRLNSPLQTLVIQVGLLDARADGPGVADLQEEANALLALSRQLADLEQLMPAGAQGLSLDAEAELRRRH